MDNPCGKEGFDDLFIDRLFEMVEITRDTDEVLNYAIIRLIVSRISYRDQLLLQELTRTIGWKACIE
jgi:hypothetical protein